MEDPDNKKLRSTPRNADDVISIVMPYVTDPKDRESASLVNRTWLRADSETRDHVTMALCYASAPDRLARRFPNLRSIKLKGKPRAAMFNLIPDNWGGFVTPWVNEIALSLRRIRSVHFRRMIVRDLDLDVLARARGDELEVLKLDKCLGFSTDGLLSVVRHCRNIKTLVMEESSFLEKDGNWLRELALHNTSLEVLNLYMTELTKLSPRDLETIARNCHRSLVSVKVGDVEMLELVRFFNAAVNLEEFCGGAFTPETPDKYIKLTFPPKLSRLGLTYFGANEMPMIFPFAAQIRKLDLLYAFLGTDDNCKLIQKCPNLEVLEKLRSTPRNADDVISIVMPYVTDPKDRESASLVNRTWLRADSETRDHVTMALCYASAPDRLARRFPNLRSLKLKGKPRAAMFNLIPENWGGFVTPWVNEIALSLRRIRSVHFRRMIVNDLDLDVLARARGDELEVLKLDKCLGFSTDGLLSVVKHCRNIKTLVMEESSFLEKDANEMPMIFPFAAQIRKLDLLYAFLGTDDNCKLIQKCPNLEVLETRNVIGDKGLEVLAQCCKQLKRLRIEQGADEEGMMDERWGADEQGNEDLGGFVTQRGLTALAQGCQELEYMAVYVTDISNESLRTIGAYLKNLSDFRLVLLDQEERIRDLPLDNGVRSLLIGCEKLRRFAFYLRPGGLTDVGLRYIGQYSPNVRWMLLGYVGETDEGLMEFSKGCPKLQKLEMRGCCFSERAIAAAVMKLPSLRYLWVQGYRESVTGQDLRVMSRPNWNIELIQARRVPEVNLGDVREMEHPAHIVAYYSLAGQRTDCPPTVRVLREV
ncbi:hypothetical protein F2Q68_00028168 [Brassica cretica]|uniref:Coronatine-insensitive protein 1 n=1 Tax=Brassica cretica TaxID=69181 RepID=A0A8S9IBE0_BRACR|nr:hypothetical protein F2Q68_00028168 [Brassica cretica]